MLKYSLGVIDHHLKKTNDHKLPLVYSLILYSGQKPFPYSTDVFDLFGKEKDRARSVFLQPYRLIDLTQVPDEILRDYYWFGAAALISKHIHDPDILPIFKNVIILLRNIENQGGLDYVYITLSYIIEAGEVQDKDEFMKAIKSGLANIEKEKIMTLVEQWKQEGFQKGIERGVKKDFNKQHTRLPLISSSLT